jgi:rubrerythrin
MEEIQTERSKSEIEKEGIPSGLTDDELRRAAADKNLPTEIAKELVSNDNWTVRVALAENENLDQEVIKSLSSDPAAIVRTTVAGRADLPKETLEKLRDDESRHVRIAVSGNSNVSTETVCLLAGDADAVVRAVAASHPKLPESLKRAMEKAGAGKELKGARGVDKSELTEEEASRLLEIGPFGMRLVAEHPSTSEEQLKDLAAETHFLPKVGVGRNPNSSDFLLQRLARDENSRVREAVASNPEIPEAAARSLVNDDSQNVRLELAENEEAHTGEVLRKLSEDKSPAVQNEAQRQLSSYSEAKGRR